MVRKYTFFMHVNATKDWLSLPREARSEFSRDVLGEIYGHYPSISVRYYDAEAFSSSCSDIIVYETEIIRDYYFMMDELRDSPLFTVPYIEVVDIIPAIEDGYLEFDEAEAGSLA